MVNEVVYASKSRNNDIIMYFGYNINNYKEGEAIVMSNFERKNWTAHNNCTHIPNAETIAAIEEDDSMVEKYLRGERVEGLYIGVDSLKGLFEELDNE